MLDEKLVGCAQHLTSIKNKPAVVHAALRTLVWMRAQAEVRKLKEIVNWEGNLDELCQSRLEES